MVLSARGRRPRFGEVAGQQGELAPFPGVHRARAGQGPQLAAEKCTTMASLPRWVHGVQDAEVFPCGQVTVRLP